MELDLWAGIILTSLVKHTVVHWIIEYIHNV